VVTSRTGEKSAMVANRNLSWDSFRQRNHNFLKLWIQKVGLKLPKFEVFIKNLISVMLPSAMEERYGKEYCYVDIIVICFNVVSPTAVEDIKKEVGIESFLHVGSTISF
jgi:hypothetical protein